MSKQKSTITVWKELSMTLKIFIAITLYGIGRNFWSIFFQKEYLSQLKPFGIENNTMLSVGFIISSTAISALFLYAVYTKKKAIFNFYLYFGLVYVPISLLLTWVNSGSDRGIGVFYSKPKTKWRLL